MHRNSCTNAFVIFTLALGTLFAVQAQEVDADALMATLNAEIKKVDDGNKDVAPQKVTPVEKNAAEESVEEKTPSAAGPQETGSPNEAVVMAVGKGETKEEAKLAAFRAAVEKAVGIYVDAESLMENSELIKDRVNTISNADIQKYETLKESQMKSGMYFCQIKAWVVKKAIAPKFADVFPAAFANVSEAAETIHVQKVTRTKRSADAASLMTGALENVDRMRNWVRLSVAKGKGLEEVAKVKNYGGQDLGVAEISGKGLYAVRYSMKIDEDAYFKGFVPHFKQTLEKMQEGEAEEGVALSSGPVQRLFKENVSETEDGCKLVMTGIGRRLADNVLRPFVGNNSIGGTYFVDPIVLSDFPGVSSGGNVRRNGGLGCGFMFDDRSKGLSKVREDRPYNIWLLDKMNKSKTSIRCSAYKVPAAALRAYWKDINGEVDSPYVLGNMAEAKLGKTYERVEIVLLDGEGEEIASTVDQVPVSLLTSGAIFETAGRGRNLTVGEAWTKMNVFESFFVRPMFISKDQHRNDNNFYSTEIQRDVYFPLGDAQLAEVKQVKVRFVGGRKTKSNAGSSDSLRTSPMRGSPSRRDRRR